MRGRVAAEFHRFVSRLFSDATETEPREQRQPEYETAERHHGQRRNSLDERV